MNIFVPEPRVPDAINVLAGLGVQIDKPAAIERARSDGMFVGRWDDMRIDVFLS